MHISRITKKLKTSFLRTEKYRFTNHRKNKSSSTLHAKQKWPFRHHEKRIGDPGSRHFQNLMRREQNWEGVRKVRNRGRATSLQFFCSPQVCSFAYPLFARLFNLCLEKERNRLLRRLNDLFNSCTFLIVALGNSLTHWHKREGDGKFNFYARKFNFYYQKISGHVILGT